MKPKFPVPFGTVFRARLNEHETDIASWPLPDELKSAHVKRKTEFALGRLALQKAFETQRIDLAPDELIFNGFQELLLVPGYRFSISHTDTCALVWLADSDECKGIGVDIEPSDRVLSEAVYKKLVHTQDASTLSPIQLWCAKEAAFKAVATEHQPDLVVAKIYLEENRFITEASATAPVSTGKWIQYVNDGYIHSFAWR
ncbi:MAG: 4'-phosphopantetheinyl transferase superfamily protein [Bdellovibrionota bacterium]